MFMEDKLCMSVSDPFTSFIMQGFFGCKHFSKANKLLEKEKLPPIDWQIPAETWLTPFKHSWLLMCDEFNSHNLGERTRAWHCHGLSGRILLHVPATRTSEHNAWGRRVVARKGCDTDYWTLEDFQVFRMHRHCKHAWVCYQVASNVSVWCGQIFAYKNYEACTNFPWLKYAWWRGFDKGEEYCLHSGRTYKSVKRKQNWIKVFSLKMRHPRIMLC